MGDFDGHERNGVVRLVHMLDSALARRLAAMTRRDVGGVAVRGVMAATLAVVGGTWSEADARKKRRKKKRKKPSRGTCPAGLVACHGECVQELAECPNGTVCPRNQLCRGTCECADKPCAEDDDCFHPVNPFACRNGCCCIPGPGGAYITGPDECSNQFCCSLRTGPLNPATGFAQCLPEDE